VLNGKTSDYEIKGTLGITARSLVRDDIKLKDYDLDVGLSQRRNEGVSKRRTVRSLKRHMS